MDAISQTRIERLTSDQSQITARHGQERSPVQTLAITRLASVGLLFGRVALSLSILSAGRAQQKVGPEFQINSYTDDYQGDPSVASLADGGFVVAWNSRGQDGSDHGVFGQLFSENGTRMGSEFQISTYTPGRQALPSVATFSNGNFVVVWESLNQDGDGFGVFGQLLSLNSTKIGSEFRVNIYTSGHQTKPVVTSFSNDDFVVAWTDGGQDGSANGVYYRLYNGSGVSVSNELRANSYTTGNQWSPAVARSSSDHFMVVWQSSGQDGSDLGVFGQQFNSTGAPLGGEFQANTYTAGDQGGGSVASLSHGGFVVAWQSDAQDGSSWGVYGQLFNANTAPLGGEFQVNNYTLNAQASPFLAGFTDGKFVVIWSSLGQDGSSYGVYGQLFQNNGTRLGSEFQVNSHTNSSQTGSSTAVLSNGNFVVTWKSSYQDGSSTGVYGQLFDPSPPPVTTGTSGTSGTSGTTGSTGTSGRIATGSASGPTATSGTTGASATTAPIVWLTTGQVIQVSSSDEEGSLLPLYVVLGIVGGLCLIVPGTYLFCRKRRDREAIGQEVAELDELPADAEYNNVDDVRPQSEYNNLDEVQLDGPYNNIPDAVEDTIYQNVGPIKEGSD